MDQHEGVDNCEEEFAAPAPAWWYVLWCAWGSCICLTVYLIDRNVTSIAILGVFAASIAVFAYRPSRCIAIALIDYCVNQKLPPEHEAAQERQRSARSKKLIDSGLIKLCIDYQRHQSQSNSRNIDFDPIREILAQYRKHPNCPDLMGEYENQPASIESIIPMAMFVGVLHGFIAGGIAGPFCNGDGYLGQLSAAELSALGCIIGSLALPIWYGFLMVLFLFAMIPRDNSERLLVTLCRRLAMLLAPIAMIKHILRQQPQRN